VIVKQRRRICELWRMRGQWLWRTLLCTSIGLLPDTENYVQFQLSFPSTKWPETLDGCNAITNFEECVAIYYEWCCILCTSFVRPGDLDLDSLPSKWLNLPPVVYDFLEMARNRRCFGRLSLLYFVWCKNKYQLSVVGWLLNVPPTQYRSYGDGVGVDDR